MKNENNHGRGIWIFLRFPNINEKEKLEYEYFVS